MAGADAQKGKEANREKKIPEKNDAKKLKETSHENVSSVFSLADCALDLGLFAAGSWL